MRIISNNKTDDYSNYLDRKKGIINYNNSLISKPQVYNLKTNNLTINSKNKIVKYKSYELANNINSIKPYFNNKCYPNNKDSKQTLNLKEGRTSNFNMEKNKGIGSQRPRPGKHDFLLKSNNTRGIGGPRPGNKYC